MALERNKTYKQLYIKFGALLCIFVIILNISAGIIQTIENKDRESNSKENAGKTEEDIVKKFSIVHNISISIVYEFIHDIHVAEPEFYEDHSITYMEAIVLVLSMFYTIGWGHVTPFTVGGKLSSIVFSFIGIPLTFAMLYTGGIILVRHMSDIIRKLTSKYLMKLLLPCFIVFLFLYILITSALLGFLEEFSYRHALYYSFITFMTIGFGDVTQNAMMEVDHIGERLGLTVFMFFWLLFGMITIAATIISLFSFKNSGSMEMRDKFYTGHQPQQLVDETDDI